MGWIDRLIGRKAEAHGTDLSALPQSSPDFMTIDVETACSRTSSICQIGVVGFTDGRVSFEFETLIDPCDEFHPFNVNIHGIDRRHVRGKPKFRDLHATLSEQLNGRITVAHSSFDRGALSAACALHQKPLINTRWLDSVKVARRAWPDLSSHRLNVLASHLGIELKHHDALSDARAAGMVIVKAIDQTGISLEDWISEPTRPGPRDPGSVKRAPSDDGPLAGEYVTFTGDMSVARSQFADQIAAAGGSVSPSPNRRTTILVLGIQDPSSFAGKAKSSKHLKAEELIAAGQRIEILSEQQLRQRMT